MKLNLKYLEPALAIIFVALYGFATYQRNYIWKDELSLWSYVVKKSPNKARPYINLASVYVGISRFPDAVEASKEALRLRSDYAEALYNLNVAEGRLKD